MKENIAFNVLPEIKRHLAPKYSKTTIAMKKFLIVTTNDKQYHAAIKVNNPNNFEILIIDEYGRDITLSKEIELVGKSFHDRYFEKEFTLKEITNIYPIIVCKLDS